jgi:hypothetical protein
VSFLDDHRRNLIEQELAKRPLRKSTFAEPASATSGLQDYDLDGKKKRTSPRISMHAPMRGSFRGASGKTYESPHKGAEVEVLPDDVEHMKLLGFTVHQISIR